jgi:hypothetical protein
MAVDGTGDADGTCDADGTAPGISAPTPRAMATSNATAARTAATAMRTPLSRGSSMRGAPCRVPRSRLTLLPSIHRGAHVAADHPMLSLGHEQDVDPG